MVWRVYLLSNMAILGIHLSFRGCKPKVMGFLLGRKDPTSRLIQPTWGGPSLNGRKYMGNWGYLSPIRGNKKSSFHGPMKQQNYQN